MMKVVQKLDPSRIVIATALVLVIAVLGMFFDKSQSGAVTISDSTCEVLLIVDRSGSIFPIRNRYTDAILNMFNPSQSGGGIADSGVNIAFWSFANEPTTNSNNFNEPYSDYVNSVSDPNQTNFKNKLTEMTFGTGTNYEQGFGYNGTTFNPSAVISTIAQKAELLVFLSDGEPNAPGNEEQGKTAAKIAFQNLINNKATKVKDIVGIFMTGGTAHGPTYTPGSGWGVMNEIIMRTPLRSSISDSNREIIPKSSTEELTPQGIAAILGTKIREECRDVILSNTYALTPKVQASTTSLSGQPNTTDVVNPFTYNVDLSIGNPTAKTKPTDWYVKRVVIKPNSNGQTATLNVDGGDDNGSNDICDVLKDKANVDAQWQSCIQVAEPNTVEFLKNSNTALTGQVSNLISIDNSWDDGSLICDVLVVEKPTNNETPQRRYSSLKNSNQSCIPFHKGIQPVFQVRGSDLYIGRHFQGIGAADHTTSGIDGASSGSWAEYGVFATGDVSNFASGAAYGVSDKHPLTFANTISPPGYFISTGLQKTLWVIPEVENSITRDAYFSGSPPAGEDPCTNTESKYYCTNISDITKLHSLQAGINYKIEKTTSGDVEIGGGGVGSLHAGTRVVINAPNSKVIITDNVIYEDGPYGTVKEIPQIIIFAKDINIKSNVERVDAWLITKPDSSGGGGVINTCVVSGAIKCNQNRLSINGPVIADKISLNRTFTDNSPIPQNPAELFNLPASTYLYLVGKKSADNGNKPLFETSWSVELPPYF